MTPITNAKHQVGEIDGVRCTIVESGIPAKRMEFLRSLLTDNKFEVKVREDAPVEGSTETLYTIGVTDILFNPAYAIYERSLLKPDGTIVTPAYYRQMEGDTSVLYWDYGKTAIPDLYE